jgi:hypothetical protein
MIRKSFPCGTSHPPGPAPQLAIRPKLRMTALGSMDAGRQGGVGNWDASNVPAMASPSSTYTACHKLFGDYPLAVRSENWSETVRSMILMTLDRVNSARFFVLVHDSSKDSPFYSLCQWPEFGLENSDGDGSAVTPEAVMNIVSRAVPIPRHGSMFGWREADTVTALIVFYADHKRTYAEPSWTVMPLAGIPEAQWPPFTDQSLLGQWFWELSRAGNIISLADLIAGSPNTVFWVNTDTIVDSDCCAVACDIRSVEGYSLQRGCYVYFEALRAGKPVPPLSALLAIPDKIDLAPRFRWCDQKGEHSGSAEQDASNP